MNRRAAICHPRSFSTLFEQRPSSESLIAPCVGCVKWGHPFLTFELCSSDPAILARAETVFRPWRSGASAQASQRWWVEPVDGADGAAARRWKIRSDGSGKVAFGNTLEHALIVVEFLAIESLVENRNGPLSLHGALVEKSGNSCMILGRKEAGKSTLACALWQRDWTLLCDDTTIVETKTGRAFPAPRRLSLRDTSRNLLGDQLWARILSTPSCDRYDERCLFHPDEIDQKKRPGSTAPAALIFLQRRESSAAPGKLERLEPADALLALFPYSNLRLNPGEAIRRIAPLADRVRAYDLGRGPLEEMVHRVERALAGGD